MFTPPSGHNSEITANRRRSLNPGYFWSYSHSWSNSGRRQFFWMGDHGQNDHAHIYRGKIPVIFENWISDQTISCLGTIPTLNRPRKRFQSFMLTSDDVVLRFGACPTVYERAYGQKSKIKFPTEPYHAWALSPIWIDRGSFSKCTFRPQMMQYWDLGHTQLLISTHYITLVTSSRQVCTIEIGVQIMFNKTFTDRNPMKLYIIWVTIMGSLIG